MADVARFFNVLLVIAAVAIGATAGIIASMRCFRDYAGFCRGAILGFLFTLLGSLMSGEFVAGRMEELLGTPVGVPFGLGLGCFAGAFVVNSLSGAVGAAIGRIMR